MNETQVYLNGKFIPASEAAIPIYDKGIVMGATVTEMTRTYHQKLFRLDDHLDRLYRSLKYTRIDPGLSKGELAEASTELAETNSELTGEELGLIHFITAGKVSRYAGRPLTDEENTPTVCVHTFPLELSYFGDAMRNGYHVVTPAIRHIPPQCLDAKMKYRSRMHWHLADEQTHQVDPNATSLLLDLDGNITECSGANFLIVREGTIYSPTLRNILAGVSRKVVIELADELGIPFKEQDLQIYDVATADEAFLSSTPFGVCPATKLNSQQIADGKSGPIWRRLSEAWSELVGLDIIAQVVGENG